MPSNIQVETLADQLNRMHQRVTRLENSPQLGNMSIEAGALQILDGTGRLVMSLGYQPDGTIGLGLYDPASGTLETMLGQVNTSPVQYGLSVRNSATNVLQLVAGSSSSYAGPTQTTTSATLVTFPDDPAVTTSIGSSGSALVTFGAFIETPGTGPGEGEVFLTVDGTSTGYWVVALANTSQVGASSSLTLVYGGMTAGPHRFSLGYQSGAAGVSASFTNRFVTVTPL